MSELQTVTLERILPTAVWIEDDVCGSRHVMLQHEGMHAFCYASFHYDYAYTCNSGTWAAAEELAISLGATKPVERRMRQGWPTKEAPPSV
jgi:hypothetical protein